MHISIKLRKALKMYQIRKRQEGFALLELALVLVVVVGIGAVGYWVIGKQRSHAQSTNQASPSVDPKLIGTSAGIDQLFSQEKTTENNLDNSATSDLKSNISSYNQQNTSIGDGYDANSF